MDSLRIHVLYIRIVYHILQEKSVFHYVYTSPPLCLIIGKSLSLFGGYLAASFPVDLYLVFSFSVHIFKKLVFISRGFDFELSTATLKKTDIDYQGLSLFKLSVSFMSSSYTDFIRFVLYIRLTLSTKNLRFYINPNCIFF